MPLEGIEQLLGALLYRHVCHLSLLLCRPQSGNHLSVPSNPAADMAVGGKGANQAVAAARLAAGTRPVRFVTRFGNDSHGAGTVVAHMQRCWSC